MAAVLVNYDLNIPGQKHKQVAEKLRSYTSWAHFGGSSWIVSGSNLTAVGVRDDLLTIVDTTDSVLTIEVSGQGYAGLLVQEHWDWLSEHMH